MELMRYEFEDAWLGIDAPLADYEYDDDEEYEDSMKFSGFRKSGAVETKTIRRSSSGKNFRVTFFNHS